MAKNVIEKRFIPCIFSILGRNRTASLLIDTLDHGCRECGGRRDGVLLPSGACGAGIGCTAAMIGSGNTAAGQQRKTNEQFQVHGFILIAGFWWHWRNFRPRFLWFHGFAGLPRCRRGSWQALPPRLVLWYAQRPPRDKIACRVRCAIYRPLPHRTCCGRQRAVGSSRERAHRCQSTSVEHFWRRHRHRRGCRSRPCRVRSRCRQKR